MTYRAPTTIADIAIVEAERREEQSERSGQLYLLAEILTALHRQAEATETQNHLIRYHLARFGKIPNID